MGAGSPSCGVGGMAGRAAGGRSSGRQPQRLGGGSVAAGALLAATAAVRSNWVRLRSHLRHDADQRPQVELLLALVPAALQRRLAAGGQRAQGPRRPRQQQQQQQGAQRRCACSMASSATWHRAAAVRASGQGPVVSCGEGLEACRLLGACKQANKSRDRLQVLRAGRAVRIAHQRRHVLLLPPPPAAGAAHGIPFFLTRAPKNAIRSAVGSY